jgi:hypothetical protein
VTSVDTKPQKDFKQAISNEVTSLAMRSRTSTIETGITEDAKTSCSQLCRQENYKAEKIDYGFLLPNLCFSLSGQVRFGSFMRFCVCRCFSDRNHVLDNLPLIQRQR